MLVGAKTQTYKYNNNDDGSANFKVMMTTMTTINTLGYNKEAAPF